MKTVFVAGSLALSMMMLAGLASADGVGACAAGIGFNWEPTGPGGTYVGVNVASPTADPTGTFGFGQGSQTGVYDDSAAYQTQCCAETGSPPDCFDRVG